MATSAHKAKNRLTEIKILLKTGKITYQEAKLLSQKPLEVINEAVSRIAKEYGKKPYKITFAYFMR